MRVLIALTYYRPHISGLTIYAERLARGLARRGHAVTVLTARFNAALAERERVDGVEIVRVPILRKLSKSVMAKYTESADQSPGSMALSAIQSGSCGKACTTSMPRWMTLSVRPPA